MYIYFLHETITIICIKNLQMPFNITTLNNMVDDMEFAFKLSINISSIINISIHENSLYYYNFMHIKVKRIAQFIITLQQKL